MMRSLAFFLGAACLAASPVFAQQGSLPMGHSPVPAMHDHPSSAGYREPLAGSVALANEPPPAMSHGPVPAFPHGLTPAEQASATALGFAAKAAFSLAAMHTGTANPVPAPSYASYRPGMPMPEPGAEPVACEPNGALTSPMACAGR